jgi:hypothetical protein
MTNAEKEFFVAAWAERLEEELPADIAVERPSRKRVSTRGRGRFAGHSSLNGGFPRFPLPKRVLVQMYFEAELDGLQFQMSYATGSAWPKEGARRRVQVRDGQLHLEFVDADGVLLHALRPIEYKR